MSSLYFYFDNTLFSPLAREAELRQLRKSSTDYELQNASLSRIVESMRTAVSSIESDINTQRANNLALSRHLDQLRASLAAAFHAVALPGRCSSNL